MSQHTSTNHRFAGYMDAFTENHLPLNMQYVPASCSSLSQVPQWIDRMFDLKNPIAPPTAICADEPFVVASALKSLLPWDIGFLKMFPCSVSAIPHGWHLLTPGAYLHRI